MTTLFGAISSEEQHMCDVFVAIPFRDEYRHIYTSVILKVCNHLNLSVKLGDDFYSNRQIMNEIWSALNHCSLVIADCTDRNPNVFYELGIAHTLEKGTIIITQKKEDIPFDIGRIRYIEYKDSVEGKDKLAEDLQRVIPKMLASAVKLPLKLKDFKRYQLSHSSDWKVLKEQSKKARDQSEYDWMELFADAWTRIAPGDERSYEDLATALIRSYQSEKAIQIGKKLTAIRKLNYFGYYVLGQAYNLIGEQETAIEHLDVALRYVTSPFKLFVLLELYEAYEALGQIENAINTMESILPLADESVRNIYQAKLLHLKAINNQS